LDCGAFTPLWFRRLDGDMVFGSVNKEKNKAA
jgi:hypothetical protein